MDAVQPRTAYRSMREKVAVLSGALKSLPVGRGGDMNPYMREMVAVLSGALNSLPVGRGGGGL